MYKRQNPTGDGETVLEAEVPMAEMMSYAIDLRSMTPVSYTHLDVYKRQERGERCQWQRKRGERVAAVKISSVRRKACLLYTST